MLVGLVNWRNDGGDFGFTNGTVQGLSQTPRTFESQLTVPIFPFMAYNYNLIRRTKATIVGSGRDGAGLQVVRSNGRGSRATGTVQRVFLRTSGRMRYEVSSVAIRTKANDIASKAFRTLHTVANTETHRERSIKIDCDTDDCWTFADLSPTGSHYPLVPVPRRRG